LSAPLQAFLDDAARGGIPALACAVTGPEQTLFLGGHGADEHSLFWLASMTKPITSVAAMQLVERGLLSLDAPIGDLLPELAEPQILEDGTLRPAVQKITLRHLLTHTAGFAYPFSRAEYAAYLAALPAPPKPGTRAWFNMPLLFEPGSAWEYGFSTDWAGLAVEAASGLRLDAYFAAHIFAPLGMVETSFVPVRPQLPMHARQPDGALLALPVKPVRAPEAFSGGGGLYGSLADYIRFTRLFLTQGGSLLRPETVREMCRNQIGGLQAGLLRSVNPSFMLQTDMAAAAPHGWGLGFLVDPQTARFGWAGAANTYFWVDPALNRAAILMMQIQPFGDEAALKTRAVFERAVYATAN
jgi:CubicO group peptidase (beta-lactamase class C family)